MYINNQKGISAILLVALIGAVALIFVHTTAIMSVDELSSASISLKGSLIKSMSFSCAEEALRRMQIDKNLEMNNYVLHIGEGICTINSTSNGNDFSIRLISNLENYYYSLNIDGEFDNGFINILNWES